MRRIIALLTIFAAASLGVSALQAAEKPAGSIKVFLLVGQSNMQGKGAAKHIEHLIADPKTKAEFQHLMKNGEHVVRDDVWIWYLDKYGDLSVGYGSGNPRKGPSIGPELGFGHVVGDRFDERVLLIKCAWGGKSMKRDFLSPGFDLPSDEALKEELEKKKKKSPDATMEEVKEAYGKNYRETLAHTREVLGNIKKYFPEYRGEGYEIAGMVWLQGWNDLVGSGNPLYAEQLAQFIRDMRKELKTPDLPVVIGESGQGGPFTDEKGRQSGKAMIRKAQAAVAEMSEFKGTVKFVETAVFHDPRIAELNAMYGQCGRAVYLEKRRRAKEAGDESNHRKVKLDEATLEKFWKPWRDVEDEWNKIGADQGYHFFGSGKLFYQMGDAFGKAMVELLEK